MNSPRKNIIRMIIVALGVIAICCILLRTASCSGPRDSATFTTPSTETKAS